MSDFLSRYQLTPEKAESIRRHMIPKLIPDEVIKANTPCKVEDLWTDSKWREFQSGGLRKYLPQFFPTIYTLCGSTKFLKEYEQVQRQLTLEGKIVISDGMFGHQEGLDMRGEVKAMLNELHLRKIDMADIVFIVNPKMLRCVECKAWFKVPATGPIIPTCNCGVQPSGSSIEHCPYIGSSTTNEINYAKSKGKEIQYLNPMEQ